MFKKRIVGLAVVAGAVLSATTMVLADGTTPINDASGNPNAPGVNVIRDVGGEPSSVVVRLNRGNRNAHFNVIVRGVEVLGISDAFPDANGVDGGHEDGVWGGCLDELYSDFGEANLTQAKFYTCSQHDSIRLFLGEPEIGHGTVPALKVVFTEGVLVNVDGVFVGNDLTDVGNSWIPLYE